ncbi:unnamed protein product [Rotaria socialis]|uniref:Fibronectin type-II domain-containing protein n=1 Tax=Rotaria socialis TaxID=392032 RepID=A0A817Q2S0_9BILA|nr:unnamed protein product [Rotaria socialis]CAF4498131.1 unnamed protein product [Rotaria socialis]CAF4507325.1 unnamed protein product [Rotaria socialis]CAF4832139.1 unnamed protein product [Rotaria socialis]
MMVLAIAFLLQALLLVKSANAQTCSYMWDPIFEANLANPPDMCSGSNLSTTSGSSCSFPFTYQGVTYTSCTIKGPNNADFRPQCATSVDNSQVATQWSFCTGEQY